jgi:hypothetical protein
MSIEKPESTRWWGEFSLREGERGLWHVGPLTLGIGRAHKEWRIERRSDPALAGAACRVELPSSERLEGDDVIVRRFSFEQTGEALQLTPRVADRSVVVYPESPFFVTAGQEIVLFCSTPLWVRLEVGENRTVLEEFPSVRPSDTWFGPSTREGELCYASTTAARLRREDILHRPHRAVTELRIRNEADDTLPIEKVNLSVPYLSLYATADGSLWSDRVTLYRTLDESRSELEITPGPPEGLSAEPVSEARVTAGTDNVMVRAFEALFR